MAEFQFQSIPFYQMLSGIGNNLEQGVHRYRVQNALKDFNGDWNAAADALLKMGYVGDAAALYRSAQGGLESFGLQPIFDEQGNAYQASNRGGLSPLEAPGGAKLTAPSRTLDTENGYVNVPARAPIGGPAQPIQGIQPRSVQTYDVSPDGTVADRPNPVLSPKAAQQKFDRTKTAVHDQQTIADFDQSIAQMENNLAQVTRDGKPSESLEAVTGAYGGVIPKTAVPTTKPESVKAEQAVKTFGVQVGLQTLAKMRAQSAQGASGMGQLAIQESLWLQNSVRSLELAQKPEDVVAAMQDVLFYSRLVSQRLKEGYQQIYGGQPDLSNVEGQMPPSQQAPVTTDLPPPPGNINQKELEAIGKARTLLQRGVSLQAVIAALRRDGVPESEIQKLTAGQ